jgi:hypothetical protein
VAGVAAWLWASDDARFGSDAMDIHESVPKEANLAAALMGASPASCLETALALRFPTLERGLGCITSHVVLDRFLLWPLSWLR